MTHATENFSASRANSVKCPTRLPNFLCRATNTGVINSSLTSLQNCNYGTTWNSRLPMVPTSLFGDTMVTDLFIICEAVNLLPSLPLIQEKKTEPYGSWKTCWCMTRASTSTLSPYCWVNPPKRVQAPICTVHAITSPITAVLISTQVPDWQPMQIVTPQVLLR